MLKEYNTFHYGELLNKQSQLDEKIFLIHNLNRTEKVVDRILAFIVEVGELANELRSFKYWSRRKSVDNKRVIEEYVDGLHFLISLAIDVKQSLKINFGLQKNYSEDLTYKLLTIFKLAQKLESKFDLANHLKLFASYLELGFQLNFSASDIKKAYFEKNKINHIRQESNY